MSKRFLPFGVLITLFLLAFGTVSSAADETRWARQFAIPGFDIIWSGEVSFGHCFAVGNDKKWHDCADMKGVVSDNYVEQKANAEYQLNVSAPGKCYSIMEAFIAEDAWLYKHIKVSFYKYNKSSGKWVSLPGPGKGYQALHKGNQLLYNYDYAVKISKGKNPLPHVKNPDGTVTLKIVLPTLEPGIYKLHFQAADRGQEVFLPSRAKMAVFFSPEGAAVPSGSSPAIITGTGNTAGKPPVSSAPSGSTQGTLMSQVPPPTAPASATDLSGNWEMTCVGGIVYKFKVSLTQTGTKFTGSMIRTNGSEPQTRIDGVISADGSLDFTRSTGNWRQHYIGHAVQHYHDRALLLEGKFGDAGKEYMDWHAVRK